MEAELDGGMGGEGKEDWWIGVTGWCGQWCLERDGNATRIRSHGIEP